jgi:hypothetical protein
VDNVHTFSFGLGRTSVGSGRIPHVSAGVQCLRGRECGSSPTSGTVFPQVNGLFLLWVLTKPLKVLTAAYRFLCGQQGLTVATLVGRRPGSRWGALVIDSCPPATMTSASPARMVRAASMMATRPDRHTLLTVMAGVDIGMPAATAACLAGFWPHPAWTT